MTLVVTERHGVVAIFSRGSDGELRQRGILDVEGLELTHVELAALGDELSGRLFWNGHVPVVTREKLSKSKSTALPKAETPETPTPTKSKRVDRSNGKRVLPRGKTALPLRAAWAEEVLDYVRAHPGATVQAIEAGTGIYRKTVLGIYRNELLDRVRVEQDNATTPFRLFVREDH